MRVEAIIIDCSNVSSYEVKSEGKGSVWRFHMPKCKLFGSSTKLMGIASIDEHQEAEFNMDRQHGLSSQRNGVSWSRGH